MLLIPDREPFSLISFFFFYCYHFYDLTEHPLKLWRLCFTAQQQRSFLRVHKNRCIISKTRLAVYSSCYGRLEGINIAACSWSCIFGRVCKVTQFCFVFVWFFFFIKCPFSTRCSGLQVIKHFLIF